MSENDNGTNDEDRDEEESSSEPSESSEASGPSNGDSRSNRGTVEQVIGVVIDAVFPEELPEIYSALKIEIPEGDGRNALDRARWEGAGWSYRALGRRNSP